jgi:hypothetical protein
MTPLPCHPARDAPRDLPGDPASDLPCHLPCGAPVGATPGLLRPLHSSAPTATRGWLLIEHSGPWPAFGHPSDLPPEVAAAADGLLAHGVRPQLIRRTDRAGRRGDGTRSVFLAGGTDAGRWLERICRRTLTERYPAGELSPAVFAAPRPPGFGEAAGALLLVCTHGRREVCCARFGRPVAVALAARFGPLVWETTHVGGDEFAANLVLLPDGAYFGRLDPSRAVAVAEQALDGRVDLDAYRGTAGRSAAAQIAEWHLRRALGERSLHALRPLPSPDPDVHRFVQLGRESAPTRYAVRLEAGAQGPRPVSITSGG